jgi:hypothetical protein
MPDDLELVRLPRADDTSLVRTETHSGLYVRGREDAARVLICKQKPKLFAAIQLGGKWGFVDSDGHFAVEPVHHGVLPFSCGLAAFSASPLPFARADFGRAQTKEIGDADTGQFGYLNLDGDVAVDPIFRLVRTFSEDLAGVNIDGKWGFINKRGSIAIEPRYAAVEDFKGGIAKVYLRRDSFFGECGFIDTSGRFVIEPRFDNCGDFSEGLASAGIERGVGYIDRTGVFAIAPQFQGASYFQNGIAQIKLNGKPSIIDRSGRVLYQFGKPGAWAHNGFIDGVARINGTSEHYDSYYVDLRLRSILHDPSLQAVDRFSEGLGEVRKKVESKHFGMFIDVHGYVDTFGKVKIEPQFRSASLFKNGRACVAPRVKNDDPRGLNGYTYGFVDEHGTMVIEPRFKWASDFHNGMAFVQDNGQKRMGYIDTTGKTIIPCQFDEARDFHPVD